MAKSRRAASGDPVGRRLAIQSVPIAAGSPARVAAGEEASCLVGDVLEVDEAAAFADDVEQVAMLAGGGVGPFAGGTLPDASG